MTQLNDFAEAVLRAGRAQHHVDEPAAQRLRDAARALAANPGAGAVDEWADALRALRIDLARALLHVWGLPDVPGAGGLLGGLVQRILRGDPALASGADADLRLGLLDLDVGVPALLIPVAGGAPVVAGLLPPASLAATVLAGPVTVDGAVARDGDAWSGFLGASIGVVSAGALAQLRETDGTTSFVAILGASFTPGIQLGLGFEINAVGGVVGVNHGVDADALGAALSGGTAVALFFPTAPADAAQRRVRLDLASNVFPRRSGSVVAGPSAELSWLRLADHALLRCALVALVELPRGRVVLLGRAGVHVPLVLEVELAAVGELDPAADLLAIDLAVVSGRMFGLLRVDGTAALRARGGDQAASVLTLGGFYPGYRADVPALPPQRRLSMGSDLPLPISFRYEGYLAVTEGTFQAGARVELGFDAGVEVHGFLEFDVIGHYDPFHVHAQLRGGVEVEALGIHFGGVNFHGVIDGPGPVVVSGRVEVEVLGAPAGWSGSWSLGRGRAAPPPPPLTDIASFVVTGRPPPPGAAPPALLRVPRESVTAGTAHDPLVDVRADGRDAAGRAVLVPLGTVTWSQTVAPFGVWISRARGLRLASTGPVTIGGLPPGVTAGPTAQFSPAALGDADRDTMLQLPAYERLPSGVTVAAEPEHVGQARPASVEYVEWYADRDQPEPGPRAWPDLAPAIRRLLAGRSEPPTVRPGEPTVTVGPERWDVQSAATRTPASSRTGAVLAAAAAESAVAVPATQTAVPVVDLWRQ